MPALLTAAQNSFGFMSVLNIHIEEVVLCQKFKICSVARSRDAPVSISDEFLNPETEEFNLEPAWPLTEADCVVSKYSPGRGPTLVFK